MTRVFRGVTIEPPGLACVRIFIRDDDRYELTEDFLVRIRPQPDIKIVRRSISGLPVSIIDNDGEYIVIAWDYIFFFHL